MTCQMLILIFSRDEEKTAALVVILAATSYSS